MKRKLVVVARFNENTEWIEEISSDWGVIVFNKGDGDENKIENVGREAHTYLHFIVENYNKLPDVIAFVQGHPFDHNRNIISNINNYSYNEGFTLFEDSAIYTCGINDPPYNHGLGLASYCEKYDIQSPNIIQFSAGAQFIVTRETIQQRNLNFYKGLLHTVSDDIQSINAYILERLWMYVFTV